MIEPFKISNTIWKRLLRRICPGGTAREVTIEEFYNRCRPAQEHIAAALQVLLSHHRDAQLLQLTLADGCGGVHHQVNCLRGLGEGNHLAQAFRAGQKHHNAVKSERDPTMWRRAVLQRVEEKAEARLLLFRRHPERLEDLRLDVLAVNTDGA